MPHVSIDRIERGANLLLANLPLANPLLDSVIDLARVSA